MSKSRLLGLLSVNTLGCSILKIIDVAVVVYLIRMAGVDIFGLFSLVVIIAGAVDIFFAIDVDSACVHGWRDIESYLDTAWSIRVVRGFVVFLLLVLFAKYFARMFEGYDLSGLLSLFALSIFIKSFTNIGTAIFYREIDVRRKFIFLGIAKFFDISLKILFWFWFSSCLGLVYGVLAASAAEVVVSYFVSSYRPKFRFDWSIAREIFIFTRWITVSGIIVYLIYQVDVFFVGKVFGIAAMGLYRVALKLPYFISEIIYLAIHVVYFLLFSKNMREKSVDIERMYRVSFWYALSIASVTSLVLIFFSEGIVKYCLGGQWSGAVPIMKILLLTLPGTAAAIVSHSVLRAIGSTAVTAMLQIVCLLVIIILIYPFSFLWGVCGVAFAVLVAVVFSLCWTYGFTIYEVRSRVLKYT